MIITRKDLSEFISIESSRFWQNQFGTIPSLFSTPINEQRAVWQYLYHLRHLEYHLNNSHLSNKLWRIYHAWHLRRLGYKTGLQIPPNTCGKGLMIWHWGPIIINSEAKLGENCTLHPMVVIGHKKPGTGAPQIGNSVCIYSGANIVGNITIGDKAIVAPNAAVNCDVPAGALVGGVPAKIIKRHKAIGN